MSIVGTILKGIKWKEDSASPVTARVDKNGFYIYWVCQNGETDTLEISSIRDTRTGKYARIPSSAKLRTTINYCGNTDALEDKQIQILYGSQFNNLDEINFSCASKDLAHLWTTELMRMAYNIYAINACPLTFLKKAHAKLRFMVEKGDVLPVKKLTRMLTKDKVEMKRIEKALELTQLPSSRSDSILIDDFTFEKFLSFYKNLVQRQELEQIFDKLFPQAQQYHSSHHHHGHDREHHRHHQLTTSTFSTSAFSSSSHSQKDNSILSGYSGKYIEVETLVHFLNKHQRDPRLNEILHPYADRQRGLDIIRTYEPHKEIMKLDCLSYDGFMRYLMSDDNAIVAPEKLDLHQDMNQPLNHYFINSSHNTYLTGHQLRGKSSVDMYRQCLIAGCRCVELDCWNGKNDEEPIITHGYTVVTEISFKEVLEAINESAFKTSPYPVILSFENHCSPRQQAKMVQYCKEIFSSDVLLTEPLSDYPLEHNVPLPSPNQLLKRIIIKNKKKHTKKELTEKSFAPSLSSSTVTTCDIEEQEIMNADEESDAEVDADAEEEEIPPINELNGELMENNQSQDIMASPMSREAEPAVEMSELVVYLQPVRFKSFEEAERRDRSYEVSSFAETQATSLLKERPIDFVSFNKRQFTRVYPKGTRVDSSNYIPQVFWNAGCQMVALNFQTFDLGMQLNMGMFDYNNRSGYILKPEFMRRPDKTFDPFTESTVDGIIAGTVSVQVISGQFLSEKRGNTFVEVEMYGLPADTARRRRTKVCQSNGVNPSWDDEPFVFKKIVLPDLASLRVAAYEEVGRSNRLIGYRILPLVGLRPGYRHLPLRSESNQPLTLPTLFLKVEVNDYVPDRLSELADALANPIAHQSMVDRHARQLMVLNEQNEQAD
uniref:Phosphoinositide phospholipase C n=1 Tax=Aceria tosichella TaxID=561515 RepID=A0A6G1S8Z6_9ACAR